MVTQQNKELSNEMYICLSRLKSNLAALVGTITFLPCLVCGTSVVSSLNICKISFCYQLLIFLLDLGQFIIVAGINISTDNDISITTSNCVWIDSLLYMLMLLKTKTGKNGRVSTRFASPIYINKCPSAYLSPPYP